MRKLILAGLLMAVALPAGAAKRVTVAQLQKSLATDISSHMADAEVAHRVGDVELSERLTDATLGRLATHLPLGPRTALALQLLADRSSFLDPPVSELPATMPPDPATQQRIMDMARGYVVKIWPHLPNFFVTRTTARFDDSPQTLRQGEWPVRMGMHLVGTSIRNLTYRDGREILDTVPDTATQTAVANSNLAGASAKQEEGMTSRGEFGPELTIVLADSAKGKVAWSHWEQTPAGLAAVYSYSVPQAVSHFDVSYCCIRQDVRRELHYGTMGRGGGAATIMPTAQADVKLFEVTPAYHGSLAIDPDSGAILRVTIEAELKSEDPISKAATMVQYGPVTIGGRTFIFPVRSMALSVEKPGPDSRPEDPSTLLVNQSTFTDYRHLGTSMRILTEATETGSANPAAAAANARNTGDAAGPSAAAHGPVPQPSSIDVAGSASPSNPAVAEAAGSMATPPVPHAPAAEPVNPEVSVAAANGVPDEPANAAQSQSGSFQLKLSSRLVDVGIVAYDKKGHAVKDLKPEDFEVYDNGRKQEVRFFSQFTSETASASPADATADRTFSNRASDALPALSATTASETGATVLLIDESHIAWPDLSHARQEILKFLGTVAPGERVGLYTMTGLGFRVVQEITTDHAALTAKLQKWMPSVQSVSQAQEEETRNRQSFDEVRNVVDLNSVNGNRIDAPDTPITIDPQLRTMGSNPGRASLVILRQVARHLSAVTGHKNLVWVSSDNVFADWLSNQVGIDKTPRQIDSFALHAEEAMNDAHVAVYPMDVSQLETSAIGAEIRTRNVELTQMAADTASLNSGSVPRNQTNGRNTAEMQQDIHPIQGPIRMVADATGGRIIRRTSDLAGALNSVVDEGHATFVVSFYAQGPADDQYHTIGVKLTGKQHGLTLRYRTGYLYSKEPATLKDRFQQAIWRPLDVSEISATAGVTPASSGAKIKLDIVTADLGLQQQAGRWMDRLYIFFIQRDDAGIHAEVEGQTLGLRLKSATYQSLLASGVPFEHVVQLQKGTASVRVLVVDENTGRMGSVTIPATALEVAH